MAVLEAIIGGLGVVAFLLFYLWVNTRNDHPYLALFFFGIGMIFINIITFTLTQAIMNEATVAYLKSYANIMFMVIMWLTIFVSVYVLISTIWEFLRVFWSWLSERLGWGKVERSY